MNFRLISQANDYFATDTETFPLLHLWSLSIEEQFYLVFPLLVFIIWKMSKQNTKILGWSVLFIAIGSFCYCINLIDDLKRFYFPLSRFWEIGVGILLAYFEMFQNWKGFSKDLCNAMSFLGLFLIVGTMIAFPRGGATPGWISLLPVLGALILIASKPYAIVNKAILSCRPVAFVGLISYSLYLWHWPLLCYFKIIYGDESIDGKWLVLALSFVVSTIIYFILEVPVRRSNGRYSIPIMIVLLLFVVSIPYGVRSGVLPPVWMESAEVQYTKQEHLWSKGAYPTMKINDAEVSVSGASPIPNILIVGDSHAEMYFNRAIKLAKNNNVNVALLGVGGCFVSSGLINNVDDQEKISYDCLKAKRKFERLIASDEIKIMIISQKWGGYNKIFEKNSSLRNGFLASIQKFLKKGGEVFVLLDAPWDESSDETFDKRKVFRAMISKVENFSWNSWPYHPLLVPYPQDRSWERGNEAVQSIFSEKIRFIETASQVCIDNSCDLRRYYDNDHLLSVWLRDNATWLDPAFERARQLQYE